MSPDLNLKVPILRRYARGALAGTFDFFHVGHKRFIKFGVEMCEKLLIGVTSDEFARATKGRGVEPFETRVENVISFLKSFYTPEKIEIIKIDDPFGPATEDEKLEALFVTMDTIHNGLLINDERRKNGLKPLDIIIVPKLMARDGGFISSSRIRLGEIDHEGNPILQRDERGYF